MVIENMVMEVINILQEDGCQLPKKIIKLFKLNNESKILDVGCGKGFLLYEIIRLGKKNYIMVESYRNDEELFNLQCWALTCQTFLSTD